MPQSSIFPDSGESPDRNPVTTDDGAVTQQYDIEKNISSLIAIPWEECPWPAVRLGLLRIAIEGAELYAYRPAFSKHWVIWYPRGRDKDARMMPREWALFYGYDVGETTESKEG